MRLIKIINKIANTDIRENDLTEANAYGKMLYFNYFKENDKLLFDNLKEYARLINRTYRNGTFYINLINKKENDFKFKAMYKQLLKELDDKSIV